jgi:hypothetical protein
MSTGCGYLPQRVGEILCWAGALCHKQNDQKHKIITDLLGSSSWQGLTVAGSHGGCQSARCLKATCTALFGLGVQFNLDSKGLGLRFRLIAIPASLDARAVVPHAYPPSPYSMAAACWQRVAKAAAPRTLGMLCRQRRAEGHRV